MEYVFLSNIIRKYIKGKSPDNNVFLFSKNDVEVSYLTPEYLRGIGSPIQVKNQKSFVWVEDGDIIILWDGSNAGEILKGKNGVLPSTMVKLLIFNDYYKEYVFYLLKFNEYKFKGKTQGSGIPHANKDEIERVKIYKIDFNEQSKIAEILMTIDDAIEKTERIIAKYRHIKQGLLQDLLTKGIDENGNIRSEATHKFKDSPLGRIPVEWECKTFSQISKVRQGLQIAISERYLEPSGEDYYLYITIDYLNNKKNIYYVKNPSKSVVCSKDDILMTRTGDTGTVVTGVEGAFHNNFFLVDFDRDIIEKDYLFYYLDRKIMKDKFINYSGTTTIPDLKHKDFYKTHIVYPKDKNEQKEISKIIKSVNSKILYEKKYLEKLYSIKQGLMQDLLSGKVRVTHLLDKGGKSDECHP